MREGIHLSIFGSSSAESFYLTGRERSLCPALRDIHANVHCYPGASIKGFGRRQSTLDVAARIEKAVRPSDMALVFNFGQADVELGYYYRAVVRDDPTPFPAFAEALTGSYVLFLEAWRARFGKPVIVKGINPSALCHDRDFALRHTFKVIARNIAGESEIIEFARKLTEIFPDEKGRFERHVLFNACLEEKCRRAAIAYFDIVDIVGDRQSGGVLPQFLSGGHGHHLANSVSTRVAHWERLLPLLGRG